MSTVPLRRRRRALLAALGLSLSGVALGRPTQSGNVIVEGGTPHQLPLAAVAELEIEVPDLASDGPVDLAVLTLGAIDVPSGRLASADGLLLEGAPFAQSIEPDRYPLQVVLARLGNGDERIAFVVVKLVDRAASTWANAVIEGDDTGDMRDDELSGFDVESGVACLFDATALSAWRTELAANEAQFRGLERVLRENRRPSWTWARVRAAGGSGYLVTSGLGAGSYASYWGKDASGALVSFVMDFDLLDWAGLEPDLPVTA
jgi:Protein of unknown function (DUF4241)